MRFLTHGAISESLYDILRGTNTQEISADDAKESIVSEIERLRG